MCISSIIHQNHIICVLYQSSYDIFVKCHYSLCITVNVDIFASINLHGFIKFGYFACIKIRVLSATGYLDYHKSNFRGEHIFVDI